ncbi:MAG: hypothetical protein JRM85_05080 [Nitrososphaerota archaeon]|jgi:hypothetical protein|nr:hypothetical protein [Nitrososphaerota archaeon]
MSKENNELTEDQFASIEQHLRTIEIMLAGLLLGRKPKVKEVAKIIGVSDKTLSMLLPEGKAEKKDTEK